METVAADEKATCRVFARFIAISRFNHACSEPSRDAYQHNRGDKLCYCRNRERYTTKCAELSL